MELVWSVPIACLISVIFAIWLAYDVLRRDRGTAQMQEIAGTIFEGATAFPQSAIPHHRRAGDCGGNRNWRHYWLFCIRRRAWHQGTSVAFLVGAICSGISGFVGMHIAVQSNGRAASAARSSLEEALKVSLRGGAVSGFLVVALSLIGVGAMLLIYGGNNLTPDNSLSDCEQHRRVSALARALWRSLRSLAAVSTPKPPTWARTWSARSSRAFPKTTRATRR